MVADLVLDRQPAHLPSHTTQTPTLSLSQLFAQLASPRLQPGQGNQTDLARRDLKLELLTAEREASARKAAGQSGFVADPKLLLLQAEQQDSQDSSDDAAAKRRKILAEVSQLDRDDDDAAPAGAGAAEGGKGKGRAQEGEDEGEDGEEEESEEEESSEEDDDEDETAELLRELEKIKRERAEEKERIVSRHSPPTGPRRTAPRADLDCRLQEREKAATEQTSREEEIAVGK